MVVWRIKRKLSKVIWILFVALAVIGAGIFYFLSNAHAFTGNNGTLAFGDGTTGSSTNRGRISDQNYTYGSPGSYAARFRLAQVANSALQFVVNRAAPTRNEKMIGYQLNNGSLYVDACLAACTSQTNLTDAQWNQTILGSGVVTRAFDIGYEQLTGRAMVVYAGNTTGKLYYCLYDGSTWGPQSTCAPTNGTNDITLTDGTTTLTGTPAWVKLIPEGTQFGDYRTNKMLLVVEDTNKYVFVTSWNGSAWSTTDRQVLTTTGGATVATTGSSTQNPAYFDAGWESVSGMEMVVYANGTALNYNTSTGSGWGSATTIATLASAAQQVQLGSDSKSNRMSLIVAFGSTGTVGSSATAAPYIWKTNGTTAGWTSGTTLAMAQDAGQNVGTAWEKANTGTPEAIFSSSENGGTLCGTGSATTIPCWQSWTQSGGFSSWTTLASASNDIIVGNELTASPNSDIITMVHNDRDGRVHARTFSGSAWGTMLTTNLTTSLVDSTTGETTNQTYTQKAYQFAYTPYSAWSLNWQVFDDQGTAGSPVAPLASEDSVALIAPLNVVRLRVNVAELGGMSQTSDSNGVRKKLQYSSGTGCPDSITCTWTDVAPQGTNSSGSPWQYASGGLSDNSVLTGTVLDGSTTAGVAFTNGTSSASNAVQTAGTVEEYDYTIQNYAGVVNTSYYFRLYDYGASTSGGSMTNLNAIPREQISNTAGTAQTNCTDGVNAIACTYPTLEAYTSSPNPPVFSDIPAGTTTPTIQLRSADIFNNFLQYVIEWCPTNSFPCSNGGSFDQTVSQTNWSGQDADSSLAYVGNTNINNSTLATYQVQTGVFTGGVTYYLRAKAIDPTPGTNTYGSYSSTVSFTTSSLNLLISGGTCIGGIGSYSTCTAGSGSVITNVKLGN